jgi:hypothetical protein
MSIEKAIETSTDLVFEKAQEQVVLPYPRVVAGPNFDRL